MEIKIKAGISNRHVHLTSDVYNMLFDEELSKKNDLNQPGEFSSNMTLSIKTEKDRIDNVRVMGPHRSYNQVEISASDAYKLGLNPPVRTSGDLANAEVVTLIGPKGAVTIKNSCIIANRHIHMSEEYAKSNGLNNGDVVKVKIDGEKSGLVDAYVKTTPNGYLEMHIDRDDGNAFMLNNDDEVTILL